MSGSESKTLPGSSRRDAAGVRVLRRRWGLGAILLGGSLLLAAIIALPVLTGDRGESRLPQEGDIAERAIKAPDDVSIVDDEATEALRRESVEQASVVYDFDERRGETQADILAQAFAAGRAARLPEGAEPTGEPGPAVAFTEALGDAVQAPESSIAYLVGEGLQPEDEQIAIRLLQSAAGRMIATDAEELARHFERRGVVVRLLGSGEDRPLKNAASVLTAEQAQELVERQADELLAEEPTARRLALRSLAQAAVGPNLDFNLRATEERRQVAQDSVKPVTIALRKGEIIVRDGDRITARHILLLRGLREEQRSERPVGVFFGIAVLLTLIFHLAWRFGTHSFRRFHSEPKDAAFLMTTLVASAAGTALAMFLSDAVAERPFFVPLVEQVPGLLYFGIPIAAATMLVRLVHNAETAVLFAIVSALVSGLQVGGELSYAVFTLAGSLTAALGAARVTQRGTLLRGGLRVALANAGAVAGLILLGGEVPWVAMLVALGLALVAGAVSGVLVSGLAPMVESVFSYTTDIKLLELANRENPLLRELEMTAPGTYHHSMMVGHLAEKAAEAIGANSLEAKVAAYYHDIGKMRRPQFFVENITVHRGENRHEKLSPSMSARIIQAHVKDGAEIGVSQKLASPILRGIRQHHGTSIIRYFFEKAKEIADPEKGDSVEEHDYRYPGPKPQTREAGILMLADSVEAASRTLADTSPARVQQLVQRITNNYFRDGQLDECSLTLRDLHAIARTFIDTLSAIRHERIDYPDPTDAEGRKLDEIANEGVVERLEPRQKDRPDKTAEPYEDDIKRLGLP